MSTIIKNAKINSYTKIGKDIPFSLELSSFYFNPRDIRSNDGNSLIKDLSSNHLDLSLNFTPVAQEDISFNGSSNRGTINNSDYINTGSYTAKSMIVFFKTNDASSTQIIYQQGVTHRAYNFYIYNNKLYSGIYANFPSFSTYLSTPINSNEWYMVSFVHNNTSFSLYKNLDFIDSGSSSVMFAHTREVCVGRVGLSTKISTDAGIQEVTSSDPYYFNGYLGPIVQYNRVLSESEIADFYNHFKDSYI